MIGPMVSLAFSAYSNKGAYALLLGSGISRASGIPTGWEVVLDLIRKVAKLEGADCEPEPASWCKIRHGAEPDYRHLLDALGGTPTERQQLLLGYFEPTEEERAQGRKLPTAAHKAIAQLVAGGYLRVIITTNFDRLTERALEEAGVFPTVISTADQLAGAMPLAHSGATVIKLHGDYRDTRIKNTREELAAYDEPMNRLLDRVLDEYGLIVSGWSGEWDHALSAAIERCPSRRFTTYWTSRSPLDENARRMANHRRAVVLQAAGADELFTALAEKVRALDDMAAPHPLSAKLAVASIKRYLVDPSAKIRLHDLVYEETEKLYAELKTPVFAADTQLQPAEELKKRVDKYNALCELLLSVIVTGAYWGDEDATKLWTACLERIANPAESGGGFEYLIRFRRYPALLLLYGAGVSAVSSGNYQTLAAVLTTPQTKNDQGRDVAICSELYPIGVAETEIGHLLPGLERTRAPMSVHLYNHLRGLFRDYLPRDQHYQAASLN